ncbi:hypothetical protein, partial [Neisseria sp.]|uniref:hypothetical protein n=1 Tax=Neisseria sp. TaxID=192066 RepID=UPI0026DD0D9A
GNLEEFWDFCKGLRPSEKTVSIKSKTSLSDGMLIQLNAVALNTERNGNSPFIFVMAGHIT